MPKVYAVHNPFRADRVEARFDPCRTSFRWPAATIATIDLPIFQLGLPLAGLPLGRNRWDQPAGRVATDLHQARFAPNRAPAEQEIGAQARATLRTSPPIPVMHAFTKRFRAASAAVSED